VTLQHADKEHDNLRKSRNTAKLGTTATASRWTNSTFWYPQTY